MKKSIIIIHKNYFLFNGEKYTFDKIDMLLERLKSNLKLVILGEELYVRHIEKKVTLYKLFKFIDLTIKNDFPQNGDILYDFEKNKDNITIYSIKGAKRIETLLKNATNVYIEPIQFIIRDIILKKKRKNIKNFKVLLKYEDYYYYLSFKEKKYNEGIVSKDIEEILYSLNKEESLDKIYTDNYIFKFISQEHEKIICKMNMGELINENIYEKQKFYSRKIL